MAAWNSGSEPITEPSCLEDCPPCEVLGRDNRFLAINKPYDIRLDGDFPVTLRKLVLRDCGVEKIWFPHQLDYATTGVICLGLNKKATAAAGKVFASRETRKLYLALVYGHLPAGEHVIDAPIASYAGQVTKQVSGNDHDVPTDFRMVIGDETNEGRSALTHATALEWGTWRGQPASKVLLTPSTGRRHQLRLHCVHLGYPIVGDATYSGDTESFRMMLHAWRLTLPLEPPAMWEAPDPFVGLLQDTCPPQPSDAALIEPIPGPPG